MSRAIACDIDGVLADFPRGFTALAHTLNSDAPVLTSSQCPSWEFKDWYIGGGPEAEKLVEDTWQMLFEVPWFWEDLEPLFPDDMEELAELHREQPIVFMTRRDGFEPWAQTARWFRRYGIQEPLLYRVHSGEEKSDLCKRLGIGVVIEDSPKYAQELIDNGISVVMIRWPYNQVDYRIPMRIVKANKNLDAFCAEPQPLVFADSLGAALSISRRLVNCDVPTTGATTSIQ